MFRKAITLLGALLTFGQTQAMDGVFDRSTEVEQYVATLNSDISQENLIEVAKPIYISGIMDDRLAQAIADRLRRDWPTLKASRDSSQYGAWMLKALGSTGTNLARDSITELCASATVPRIKTECADQLHQIDWQRRKNEIMASRENHREGDVMRVSQLLNLLKSDDFSYKQDAAYRMSWDKILDARLMDEIATQLQAFADHGAQSNNKAENVAMSHYAKMLGYSNNQNYSPVLLAVHNANPDYLVEKQVTAALKRLNINYTRNK